MMDVLFDGGWITNAALLFLAIGYTIVGLGFGFIWGDTRARRDEARSRWSEN